MPPLSLGLRVGAFLDGHKVVVADRGNRATLRSLGRGVDSLRQARQHAFGLSGPACILI